ncbi:MAG: DUF6884 domain-containing protein [Burkholderiales bacterium]
MNAERERRNGTQSIFLVSCVSRKAGMPLPARALYTSDLFRKVRAFVERAGGPWFILSAEHGLVHPDTVIARNRPVSTLLSRH